MKNSFKSSAPIAPIAPKNIPIAKKTIEAHDVKKGKYVMIKGKPCLVLDVKTSKA